MYIILYIQHIYLKNTVHKYVQWMYTFYKECLQLWTFNVHVLKESTQFCTFNIYNFQIMYNIIYIQHEQIFQ